MRKKYAPHEPEEDVLSVARGTAQTDSDIDLLVVVDREDFWLRRELISIAFDILLETGLDLSVKVISSRDFQARKSFSFLIEKGLRAQGAVGPAGSRGSGLRAMEVSGS